MKLYVGALLLSAVFLSACTKSEPSRTSLGFSIKGLTFSGKETASSAVASPSSGTTVQGECDKRLTSIEYSTDGIAWSSPPTDNSDLNCSDGRFSIALSGTDLTSLGIVTGFSAQKTIFLRGRSKLGLTATSQYTLTYTPSAYEAVVSGAPTGVNNTVTLNASVGGPGVSHYKYKIDTTNSCSDGTGPYTSTFPIATPIANNISALSDGPIYLCALGCSTASGPCQAPGFGFVTSWTKDTAPPVITSISASNADGTYFIGDTVHVQVVFSEPVNVPGGTHTLDLNTSPSRSATYVSGSGTNTLVFDYTVAVGDTATDLNATSLTITGTLADPAGNSANLTMPSSPNNLSSIKDLKIEGQPAVLSITNDTTVGSYCGTPASTIAFGNQCNYLLWIKNDGFNTAKMISLSSLTAPFTMAHNCPQTLRPTETCAILINFKSPGLGSFSQTQVISYDDDNDGVINRSTTFTTQTLLGTFGSTTVAALYPTNGANWNDYVAKNSSLDEFSQTDTACPGTASTKCLHGGEKRASGLLTNLTTCAGVTTTDALDLFNWTCKLVGGTAKVISTGLKEGKGLRDLIGSTTWTPNYILVKKDGLTIFRSDPATWWGNPVTLLSGTINATFSTPSEILYADTNITSSQLFLNANKIALVTKAGKAICMNAAASTNCNDSNGLLGGANAKCVIQAGINSGTTTRNFLWIEADISGSEGPCVGAPAASTAHFGALLGNIAHARIHNTSFANTIMRSSTDGGGLVIRRSGSAWPLFNMVLNSSAHHNQGFGLLFDYDGFTTGNIVSKFTASNNGFGGSNFAGIKANSEGNIFSEILAVSNANAGILVTNNGNTFSHLTVVNNSGFGLKATNHYYLAINNGLFINNTSSGVNLNSITEGRYSQLYFFSNATDIYDQNGSYPSYKRNIFASTCSTYYYSSAYGLTDGTCAPQSPIFTSFFSTTSHVLTGTFSGANYSDSANANGGTGTSLFTSIYDFTHFGSLLRTWSQSSTGFPSAGWRGPCTSGTCSIFNYTLKSTDALVRSVNGSFAAGSDCPSISYSWTNHFWSFADGNANKALMNAVEIIGDGIGNEDGLCNVGEACVYSPNLGAYQGHGDYMTNGTCNIAGPDFAGTTIYGYPNNGY